MQLYEPLGRAISALVAHYDGAERATLIAFLVAATAVLEAKTASLRQAAPPNHTAAEQR